MPNPPSVVLRAKAMLVSFGLATGNFADAILLAPRRGPGQWVAIPPQASVVSAAQINTKDDLAAVRNRA
jgi:hypothetical protein